MNKHEKEVQANEKRIEEGKISEERRRKRSLDSFRCYIAYMKVREKL